MKSGTPLKTLRTSFLVLLSPLISIPASADPYVLDCSSGYYLLETFLNDIFIFREIIHPS
jgi:hypothetical protein